MGDTNRFTTEFAAFYDASHNYGDIDDELFYLDTVIGTDGAAYLK